MLKGDHHGDAERGELEKRRMQTGSFTEADGDALGRAVVLGEGKGRRDGGIDTF